jgi:RNA-directed DNA polymerase
MSTKPNPTILDLDHDQARRLLMQPESYCTINLPDYINFSDILNKAESLLHRYASSVVTSSGLKQLNKNAGGTKQYRSDSAEPKDLFEGVNYRILQNKDGLLSWRPMELINPMIYVALVNKLTEEENWNLVRNQFALFRQSSNVECCSIPRGLFTYAEKGAILNWWETFEQRSIALSLEYQYMGKTDISDCYGAIYTHSIVWALHGKSVAKHNRSQTLVGNYIDSQLQDMHSQQTVGIPQGSVLSDLLSEIVLGYADYLLVEELSLAPDLLRSEYKILRYRDDYRIFASSREDVHLILLSLMKVLSGLNFKLGAAKTSISDDVILDSVKPDKVDWLLRGHGRMGVHKKLLALSRFARDYPHSGTIVRELQKLSNYLDQTKRFPGRRDVLIAQVVDVIVRNPRCYPIGARILSQLLEKEERAAQVEYLEKIIDRCRMIPNSGLFEIWLQRIARAFGIDVDYGEPLCCGIESVVIGNQSVVNPWPWQWLMDPLRKDMEGISIFDFNKLTSLSAVISSDEVGDLSSYPRAHA